jgi:hypothetical protein
LTRISGAQRGLNSFLDQIVNARSDASAAGSSTEGGNTPAFDSHFARFSPDANANSLSEGSGSPAGSAAQDTSANQNKPANPVSALFAALANGDSTAKSESASSTLSQSTAQIADLPQAGLLQANLPQSNLPQSKSTDSASALFAALAGNDQNDDAANLASSAMSDQSQARLSTLLSLANKSVVQASDSAAANNQVKTTATALTGDDILSLAPARLTVQKSIAASGSNQKRADSTVHPVSKHADQASSASADLSASAQVTVAMVAASLSTPQNTPAPQPVRKDASNSSSGLNMAAAQGKSVNGSPLSEIQSASDAVQPLTQDTSSNPFADLTDPADDSAVSSIKMTVSSIEAQTHFAPVQQLSPTQQIFDFVALTGGVSSLPASSTADAATVSSAAADPASSVTASLAASPVKTLTLALEPDALGTVTIKMRLVNSGLEVQVEAEKADTTSLIEKDKDSLSDKLQSLGYSVDSLVVKTVAAQGANLDPSSDQSTAGQGQQAANDAAASGSSQNGGRNAGDQSSAQNRGQSGGGLRQDGTADLASVHNVGDGVYL